MTFLHITLAVLALLSGALAFWQWLAARRFPLHRRAADTSFTPAVTLLKPLKGCDETTAASLASWFHQDYAGPVQILFGVADPADPVCPIVNDLIAQNPKCHARLVICGKMAGANAKVAKLAELAELAEHDLVLVSDADVRIPPDFLANIVAPMHADGRAGGPLPGGGGASVPASRLVSSLAPPKGGAPETAYRAKVGLVCCFYRLANPTTTAMRWEAIAINADFWSQVLQAAGLKSLDFALGAVMLTRRKLLDEIGGFKALADCLADDYQLGHRIARRGHRIALCPVVVECWDAPATWRGVWQHQLRWARTIRVCQPTPYFFSILSNATLWPILWLAVELKKTSVTFFRGPDSLAGGIGLPCGIIIAVALLLIRIAMAQNLQRRFTPNRILVSPFWLVPVKDLFQALIWFCAFTGNTVEWRGRRMKLKRDGTLVE